MLPVAVALLSVQSSNCTPVKGAESLWLPSTRWVIVGEIHGTNEEPDAFVNLVCLAAKRGRQVTVALELSSDWQQVVDRFIDSDGSSRAVTELLELPIWQPENQDGRGSAALLRTLEALRIMKASAQITRVICADAKQSPSLATTRDAAMAQAWQAAEHSKGVVMALTGNVHAMRHALVRSGHSIVTAASLMAEAHTVTVNIANDGGKAWDCENDGCGEHENGKMRLGAPGIRLTKDPGEPWQAIYELGVPTTASKPVIPDRRR